MHKVDGRSKKCVHSEVAGADRCNSDVHEWSKKIISREPHRISQNFSESRGSIHSSLVPTSAFINKNSCVTNHDNFIYPCQAYSFEATNYNLNPAFKWNIFMTARMSFKKCTIFTYNCMLHKYLLAESSANDMTRSSDALAPHLVRFSYYITYQEWYILYTICLQ